MDDNQFPEALPVEQPREDAQRVAEEPAHQAEEGTHTKRASRSRRKKAEEAIEQAIEQAASETNGQAEGLAEGEIPNNGRPWVKRFGHFRNNDAGVRTEVDRQNHLHTIIFRDHPIPEDVINLLEDRGWVEDRKGGGYSKKIDKLRRAESAEEAEQAVLDVANIILEAKGLEPLKSFFVSRS